MSIFLFSSAVQQKTLVSDTVSHFVTLTAYGFHIVKDYIV